MVGGLAHVNEVESLGGQIVSVTEPSDATTSMGSFMRTQTFAMAQMYSKQIVEGWMRVHEHRVDAGLPCQRSTALRLPLPPDRTPALRRNPDSARRAAS